MGIHDSHVPLGAPAEPFWQWLVPAQGTWGLSPCGVIFLGYWVGSGGSPDLSKHARAPVHFWDLGVFLAPALQERQKASRVGGPSESQGLRSLQNCKGYP